MNEETVVRLYEDEIWETLLAYQDRGIVKFQAEDGNTLSMSFSYDHVGGLEGFYSDTYEGTLYVNNEAYGFEAVDIFCDEGSFEVWREESEDLIKGDEDYVELEEPTTDTHQKDLTPKEKLIMTQAALEVRTVILIDEDKNLAPTDSVVAKFEDLVIPAGTDGQMVLLGIAVENDLNGLLVKHNKKRADQHNKAALERHGKKVPLEPITIHDVTIIMK